MKRCRTCEVEKPPTEFNRNPQTRDGLAGECRECAHERNRLWRAANRKKLAAAKRAWDLANPERKREHDEKSRAKRREQIAAKHREDYWADPERHRESARRWRQSEAGREWWRTYERDKAVKSRSDRAYYEANRDKVRAQNRAWYEANREVHRAANRIAKARRRGAPGRATAEQIATRVAFYGGRCWMCGAPWAHIDHVKPLVRGGSNWPANLRPACGPCNLSKRSTWPYSAVIERRRGPLCGSA